MSTHLITNWVRQMGVSNPEDVTARVYAQYGDHWQFAHVLMECIASLSSETRLLKEQIECMKRERNSST